MNAKEFLEQYDKHTVQQQLLKLLKAGDTTCVHVKGLIGSGAPILVSSIFHHLNNDFLILVKDREEAEYFKKDMENILQEQEIHLLPDSYRRPFKIDELNNSGVLQRSEVINHIIHVDTPKIVVSYPAAVIEKVISKEKLAKNTFDVKVGETFDLDFFIDLLVEYDFERVDFCYEAGQFSIRGGIVDVYSFANELPYRIELDGRFVESIRTFDPDTQLSVKKSEYVSIVPNIQKESVADLKVSLFKYISKDTIIFTRDTQELLDTVDKGWEEAAVTYEVSEEKGEISKPELLYDSKDDIVRELKKRKVVEFGHRYRFRNAEELNAEMSHQPSFHKNFDLLINNLKENQEAGFKNLIFSDNSRQIDRLNSIFEDLDKEVHFTPIFKGLTQGYIDKHLKLACYTEHQIFDRFYKAAEKKKYSQSQAITLKELKELKPGDFVTHIDHGVGKFGGLEKIEVQGVKQEAVRLVYKNGDLLYVGIGSLHKISKYVGKEGSEPKMNKLGSDAWQNLKRKTKAKVKDIARDLIKLYAKRKAEEGYAFAPDSYLQVELEASFIYEDTPDQSKATDDFKKDMESPHPMDRLICGDVGFGKTEVAIRAAFKAVADSKQVAVLVPTTILAHQHFRTFKERLHNLPCNIDYLNRFRSAKQTTEIKKKLASGEIDIVIGTHKLISKDIKFKDLGLLIIDEEQKFGVTAKERLKELRVNVDTLTLTATPIPRTLHFSLMGARDLSIINTPPPNRQPVQTELHTFNKEIIKEAVERELERGGQMFFVHNRVKDIHEIAGMINEVCPDARVIVGHGQMGGEELENVMVKFVEHEYDVLVATTIIESGLDIPNANTIIINNAHYFGLSDMHQMRGRVGRSNKKAYCYLMSPPLHGLTDEAKRRLNAIEEFSDLGSGFNVAMRDLDIRGAGNLLGSEQSGFINEIGFDMYHKILDEAIQELKDEEFSELFEGEADKVKKKNKTECQIDTDFEILIPDSYVANIAERLSLYSELSKIEESEKLQEFQDMMIDRFGPLPDQTKALIQSVKLKWLGTELGLEKIIIGGTILKGYFPSEAKADYFQSNTFGKIIQFVRDNPSRCNLRQTKKSLVLECKDINELFDGIKLLSVINSVTILA